MAIAVERGQGVEQEPLSLEQLYIGMLVVGHVHIVGPDGQVNARSSFSGKIASLPHPDNPVAHIDSGPEQPTGIHVLGEVPIFNFDKRPGPRGKDTFIRQETGAVRVTTLFEA